MVTGGSDLHQDTRSEGQGLIPDPSDNETVP